MMREEAAAMMRTKTERIITASRTVVTQNTRIIHLATKRGWFGSYKIDPEVDVAKCLERILAAEIVIESAQDIIVLIDAGQWSEAAQQLVRLCNSHGIE